MPILVKDHKFFQTENFLTIHVPLHGIPKTKIDLLTSENYIKASFEQFFFEVFLLAPIDVDKSKCTINENEIIFELSKQEKMLWDELEKKIGKDEKRVLKGKAFEEVQERLKKEYEDKLMKKDKLKKCAITEAIGMDTQQRKKIEKIRSDEKAKALGDINEWNKELKKKKHLKRIPFFNNRDNYKSLSSCVHLESDENIDDSCIDYQSNCDENNDYLTIDNQNNLNPLTSKSSPCKNSTYNEKTSNPLIKNSTINKSSNNKRAVYYKNLRTDSSTQKNISIPLPRTQKIIDVEFTERALPTPSRESQKAEEDEWLSKQAEARRSAGFVSEDLRAEEKNPQFLLAKGNKFLKNGNLLGAISAYSFGVQISPKFVDLYIQRSEAQYLLGNYHKTVNDCSSALDLMKPEVSANLEQRAICIGRRGMALHHLGMKRQALDELKASLCLNSGNAEFGQYYYKVLDELNSKKCDEQEEKEEEKDEPGFDLFK